MKPAAIGRILFWRHGSLWIGLAGEPSGMHAHHAVQITLPFPGNRVRLQGPDEDWREFAAAIVAANQPHGFEARGQHVAQIFLDPESRAGRVLQREFRDKGIEALPLGQLEPLVAKLASGYRQRVADGDLPEQAAAVVETLAGAVSSAAHESDKRIASALAIIRKRLGGALSLDDVAAEVHLSPDRFRHLFIAETGVAFRAYLLWLRLECALTAYVAGNTLTEAAHIGGFADSAHFSRTFRRMFGIAPASVRPE